MTETTVAEATRLRWWLENRRDERIGVPVPLKSFFRAFLIVCPVCGATVLDSNKRLHADWHIAACGSSVPKEES